MSKKLIMFQIQAKFGKNLKEYAEEHNLSLGNLRKLNEGGYEYLVKRNTLILPESVKKMVTQLTKDGINVEGLSIK